MNVEYANGLQRFAVTSAIERNLCLRLKWRLGVWACVRFDSIDASTGCDFRPPYFSIELSYKMAMLSLKSFFFPHAMAQSAGFFVFLR